MYFKTTRDIWLDLEGRFGKTSSSQIYLLQENFANTYQEPNMLIATNFTYVMAKSIPIFSCYMIFPLFKM